MAGDVIVIDHPVVQHKLTQMRDKESPPHEFRRHLREISMLCTYEVTRDLPLTEREIETPVGPTRAPTLAERKLCLVSILRAGNGIVDGMLEVLPTASVGHIGLYRDPETLVAVEYYFKMPEDVDERHMFVADPMLATANSAIAAVSRLKETNPLSMKLVCLVAAPEGIEAFHGEHPDITIYTAAVDSHLDEHGYIVPGLGDAGDRLYGTR
ncbi:MAG: uracil phosphoribosyltransferase [Rhodospirillaceae bacterium]|jgi:uracil phosphoribosyltransferase|nr:uracil phosphoribosyltransferase [Rhodospirillaceae bacterium]MBT6119207.1 uracil phosphoribosyltransferase [Rhodospirillaceae bacterium]